MHGGDSGVPYGLGYGLGHGRKKEIDASLDCNAAYHATAAYMLHLQLDKAAEADEVKLPIGQMHLGDHVVRQRLVNGLLTTGLHL